MTIGLTTLLHTVMTYSINTNNSYSKDFGAISEAVATVAAVSAVAILAVVVVAGAVMLAEATSTLGTLVIDGWRQIFF